ncbi:protein kinase superfamily domain-containing protein [Histoplasma capsulatum]|uniref:Protein kinase superfamily domain-containing protein n=1 Tax=Ajellomyces capsulatus TaxID=5037 RepID=A0A8A1MAC7_AJECA|nr:protein kinase superfamily domain-containing protein [Histoplasma capsulatum]
MPGHTSLPRGPEGTIYEASGFDDDLRIEIDPTKIKFIKELKTSEASSIFHVNYDGMPRVLKVFYGYTLSLRPTALAPHLDVFQHDSGLPSAILMEYLPNPLVMNCITYSKERMAKAVKGIQQIHSALVEHNDPYPKNIMIVPDDSERVVWIDFDVAITYPDSTYIGDREHGWIEIETRQIESVGVKLVDASDDIHFLFPCH